MTVLANLLAATDDVLRGRINGVGQSARGTTRRYAVRLGTLLMTYGLAYGAAMGSFGGVANGRAELLIYSAVKVPLLLGVTFAIAIPSFFVLNTLLGVRDDFRRVFSALVEAQAGLTVVLASMMPLTLLWYASVDGYPLAILFNAMLFGIASVAGQWILRRRYQPLIERNAVHRHLQRGWLIIYAFVGIQMGWVLRPFIGAPEVSPQFFRDGAWGNAYIEVMRITINAFG